MIWPEEKSSKNLGTPQKQKNRSQSQLNRKYNEQEYLPIKSHDRAYKIAMPIADVADIIVSVDKMSNKSPL